jgi:hypothetical protein
MPAERVFHIKKITPEKAGTPFTGGEPLVTVQYNGEEQIIQL